MDRNAIEANLTSVFRDVFSDAGIVISDDTSAEDIEGWDSITHVNLIMAVERAFEVGFTTREIRGFKNVGDLVEAILKKTA